MSPIFFKSRDLYTLQRFSRQLVQDIMDVQVTYFKIDPSKMQHNVYGQSRGGRLTIDRAINIKCIVDHEPYQLDYNQILSYQRNVTFRFLDGTLKEHNLRPQIGDFIRWKNLFWQITRIGNSQHLGNRQEVEWSKSCQATVVSDSKVKQLLEFKQQMRSDGYFQERY